MKHHNIKQFKDFFQPIVDCRMRSIIRYDDRGYAVGDTVTLHEGWHEDGEYKYTGRTISGRIAFIDNFGCQPGYVCMSLEDVGLLIADDLPGMLKLQAY